MGGGGYHGGGMSGGGYHGGAVGGGGYHGGYVGGYHAPSPAPVYHGGYVGGYHGTYGGGPVYHGNVAPPATYHGGYVGAPVYRGNVAPSTVYHGGYRAVPPAVYHGGGPVYRGYGYNGYGHNWHRVDVNRFNVYGYQRGFVGYRGWRPYGTFWGLVPPLAAYPSLGFLSSGLLLGSYLGAEDETVYVYVVNEDGHDVQYQVDSYGNVLSAVPLD
jgi:hypothetical protein